MEGNGLANDRGGAESPDTTRNMENTSHRRESETGSMNIDTDNDAEAENIERDEDDNSTSVDNFSEVDNFEFDDDLGINMENKNTQRKTDTDIRILITYLRSLNEIKPPENVSPLELDRYLSNFFSIVKKHDGNEYEPASLRGMLCSVERYLKMKNYPASVTRDLIFANTRHALKLKQQKLREIGKGTKKPTEPFGKVTLEKVDQLFVAREMGPYTPMSVINTLCFVFIVHFRLRKAIDHKNLLWGDVRLKTNENGKEYLSYDPFMMQAPEPTKSESNSKAEKSAKLSVFAKPDTPEKDPVGIYKLYAEKRPATMQYDSSPFYLGITTLHPTAMQAWYRTCAMGVNKLSDLVRMIRDITGLPRATLNAPAETLLAESYATNNIVRNDITYPITNSSRTYTPILPKTPEIALRISKPVLQKQASRDFEQDRIETENSIPTIPQSVMQATTTSTAMLQTDSVSETSSRPSSADSSVENFPPNEMYLNLESAKSQINEMLQKMDLTAIVEFDRWLKTIRINRDPKSGNVVCRESSSDILENDNINSKEKTSDLSSANITLNISLSPQSLVGKGVVTVTAKSDVTTTNNNNNNTTTSEGNGETNQNCDSGRLTMATNATSKLKRSIQDSLSKRKTSSSDQSSLPAKRPRSSGCVPVNLSNKPSSCTISSSLQTTSDSESQTTVPADIATTKQIDSFAKNGNSAITNSGTRSSNSVLSSSLMTSITSAPQAHTPFFQKFADRDTGLLMPLPIAYAGQKYFSRENLMLPSQAIFASLSQQPATAHAAYLSQNYLSTISGTGTMPQPMGAVIGNSQCMKSEPS